MLHARDRYIPRTIATQHPDNAMVTSWHHSALVNAAEEVFECVTAWQHYGCEEVKWDWEGKLVEESVLERLFMTEGQYLSQHPLGEEHFLTFRIPHPDKEKNGRYWRSLTSVITSRLLAEQLSLECSPVSEVILPMTTTAQELIQVHQDLQALSDFYEKRLVKPRGSHSFRLIPLVESIEALSSYDEILAEYAGWYKKTYDERLLSFRPYIARSDPALQSGVIAAVLASKLALSKIHAFADRSEIEMYPIVGMGALPFRGGLTPQAVGSVLDEYKGVATFTIQSAFRYDYPIEEATKAIRTVNESEFKLPHFVTTHEEQLLKSIMKVASSHYASALNVVHPLVTEMAKHVPKRRERFSSAGNIFAYKREAKGVSLPRAITFTACMYSLGLPPELLGAGAALQEIRALPDGEKILRRFYPSLLSHLEIAGRHVNIDGLRRLAAKHADLKLILKDLELLEKVTGLTLGPVTNEDQQHCEYSTQVIECLISGEVEQLRSPIEQSAVLRKSIG